MFHIAASSRWPRSVRAEMNYVCSTPIGCSDRDNCSTKGTFCTFECVPGRAVYMHIPQKTQRKSVTKCLHLRVNELDQGRHARHRKRKQKATQTVCSNPPPTPSSLSLHHLFLRLADGPYSAVFVCFGSVPFLLHLLVASQRCHLCSSVDAV